MNDVEIIVNRDINTENTTYKVAVNIGTKHEWARTITLDNNEAKALADAIYAELGLGWLPYPENIPEDEGPWLVQTEGSFMVEAEYNCEEGWWWEDTCVDSAIAFMPLPSRPSNYPSPYQPA